MTQPNNNSVYLACCCCHATANMDHPTSKCYRRACKNVPKLTASMPVNTVGNWMLPIDTQNAPRIAKTMIPNSTHLFSLTLCLGTDHNCLPSDPTTRTHWMRAREERQRRQLKNGKRYVVPHSLGVCP